jgi:hypothetical protein
VKLIWVKRRGKRAVRIPRVEEIRARLAPTVPQAEFLENFDERLCKFNAFVGGVGSGKSHLGAHYALEMAARNPAARGFIAANTYPQLWQSTLTALYKVCKAYQVPVHPLRPEAAAKKKVLYLWNQVEVLCRSAERYSEWDGTEVGWFWLDEAKTMPEGAFIAVNERLRDTACDYLCGWLSTTPDGYNWVSDLQENPRVRMVRSLTKENTNLPEGYVETLLETMSPEMVAQQLEGKFINVCQGECYPHFSRAENTGNYTMRCQVSGARFQVPTPTSDTRHPTPDTCHLIGIDFNVEPGMHAYLVEIRGDDVFVLDEIYIRGGDTPGLAKEIERRYGLGIPLVPDAAGGQRHTTGTSDHSILREAGFKLKNRPTNPPVKNRINAVNAKIKNALGQRHLFVDKNCKLLIRDLERCTWEVLTKVGYRGPLTHPGAALGYAVHLKFPFSGGGFGVALPKVI